MYSNTVASNIEDFGLISLMYHRFEENKYPSTNIKISDQLAFGKTHLSFPYDVLDIKLLHFIVILRMFLPPKIPSPVWH